MCARRFLFIIFVMTLLVVAGAFALYQWGSNVLVRQATPSGHYAEPPATSAPDYSLASAWLARPGMAGDPSLWLPDGVAPADPRGDAAIFYIHPTTFLGRERWNALLQPDRTTEGRSRLFVETQASAFSAAGQIWAPRYRQAAYGAFLLANRDAAQALDLAYGDVAKAFDRFLSDLPADRPIILAGHSQGSLHLLRLLQDNAARLKGRMVAAYVVGWPVSVPADLAGTTIKPCAGPSSTGCVISWQSFGQPANPKLILDAWESSPGRFASHRRQDIVCTDPVTGMLNGQSQPADNPGTLVPASDFASATIVAGAVGARCDNGFLLIDGAIPKLGPFVLPGNNYHVYDYALFWNAIRRDAQRRLAAWQ